MEKIILQRADGSSFYCFNYAQYDLRIFVQFFQSIRTITAPWKEWAITSGMSDYWNDEAFLSKTKDGQQIQIWDEINLRYGEPSKNDPVNLADYTHFTISIYDFIKFLDQWDALVKSGIPEIRLIRDDQGKIWLEGGEKTNLPESDAMKLHDHWIYD